MTLSQARGGVRKFDFGTKSCSSQDVGRHSPPAEPVEDERGLIGEWWGEASRLDLELAPAFDYDWNGHSVRQVIS